MSYVCTKCNGKKWIPRRGGFTFFITCPLCKGVGYLDWIQVIIDSNISKVDQIDDLDET